MTKVFLRAVELNLLLGILPVTAQVNYWTNSSGGHWEEPFWSLGTLPSQTQSVVITNATVWINQQTTSNYPGSLLLTDLTVPVGGVLVLDRADLNTPLDVASNLYLGGTISNRSSGLLARNLTISNSSFFQSEGYTRLTNGTTYIYNNGNYRLSNGLFLSTYLDFPYNGYFRQDGGTAQTDRAMLRTSDYELHAGELRVASVLSVDGGEFLQDGGTNKSQHLSVFPSSSSGPSHYLFKEGAIFTSNTTVGAFMSVGRFDQQGGQHWITDKLSILGSGRYFQRIPALYNLQDGVLSVRSLEMRGSTYQQSGGVATILEEFQLNSGGDFVSDLSLSGGRLFCNQVSSTGDGADIHQSGGIWIITNLFSFGGLDRPAYRDPRRVRYNFTGGSLVVSNMEMFAEWSIGSSTNTGRIENSGFFKLGGLLLVGSAEEQLGRFILASNSIIDLGPGTARLSFADSSAESWYTQASLSVTNWNGSISDEGEDRLFFGRSSAGLHPAHLSQIRFINPHGFPAGNYPAKMLGSGEVVPVGSAILYSRASDGGRLFLSWSGNLTLEYSTNVAGPYQPVPGASSPFTNDFTATGQRYFRLRE